MKIKIKETATKPNEVLNIQMRVVKPTVSEQKIISNLSSALGSGIAAIGVLRKSAPLIISGGVILAAGLAGLLHGESRKENE